jgi:ribose-phosphate pyrophosphokinase
MNAPGVVFMYPTTTVAEDHVKYSMKIFYGTAHPELTAEICRYLKVRKGKILLDRFSDGEIRCQILENVRGRDVYIVQPTCVPTNESIMEMLIMLDAFRRASVHTATAVIPYFGYARQDRKDRPRVAITAKLVADLLEKAGADRVLTMDLHAAQIQGYFNVPVDNLYATPALIPHLKKNRKIKNPVVVSPDAGGVERARAFAKKLDSALAIVDKRRDAPNVAEVMNVIGDVAGRDAIIVDDMVDTAGTLTETADALIRRGATSVSACCVHPVLSGPALKRLENSSLSNLIVTNTIPLTPEAAKMDKISVVSIAHLLGEAIKRICEDRSVTILFN